MTEVHERLGASWSATAKLDEVAARAFEVGVRRIQMLAWRDLDDPEAGGSERHAHRVASLWASAGLDVTMRTSVARGHRAKTERDGYHVLRKGRRYWVFPRSAVSGMVGRGGGPTAGGDLERHAVLLAPVGRCPRIVFLHHVHAEMWQMILRPWHARVGAFVERRVAPPHVPGHPRRHTVGIVAPRDRRHARAAVRHR